MYINLQNHLDGIQHMLQGTKMYSVNEEMLEHERFSVAVAAENGAFHSRKEAMEALMHSNIGPCSSRYAPR